MKNWVAEGVASDVNDFKSYTVQMSGLKDENTIFRCWPNLWTISKTALRKMLISNGEWHSLLASLKIMSHFSSMLKPQS